MQQSQSKFGKAMRTWQLFSSKQYEQQTTNDQQQLPFKENNLIKIIQELINEKNCLIYYKDSIPSKYIKKIGSLFSETPIQSQSLQKMINSIQTYKIMHTYVVLDCMKLNLTSDVINRIAQNVKLMCCYGKNTETDSLNIYNFQNFDELTQILQVQISCAQYFYDMPHLSFNDQADMKQELFSYGIRWMLTPNNKQNSKKDFINLYHQCIKNASYLPYIFKTGIPSDQESQFDINSFRYERYSITKYTQQSYFFRLINTGLRKLKNPLHLPYIRYPVSQLFRSLLSLHYQQLKKGYFSQSSTVYRGCKLSQKQRQKLIANIGQTIQTQGFLSTSENPQEAYKFLNDTQSDLIIIKLPAIDLSQECNEGRFARILELSNVYSEKEVLFNPLNKFKILKCEKLNQGLLINLQYILNQQQHYYSYIQDQGDIFDKWKMDNKWLQFFCKKIVSKQTQLSALQNKLIDQIVNKIQIGENQQNILLTIAAAYPQKQHRHRIRNLLMQYLIIQTMSYSCGVTFNKLFSIFGDNYFKKEIIMLELQILYQVKQSLLFCQLYHQMQELILKNIRLKQQIYLFHIHQQQICAQLSYFQKELFLIEYYELYKAQQVRENNKIKQQILQFLTDPNHQKNYQYAIPFKRGTQYNLQNQFNVIFGVSSFFSLDIINGILIYISNSVPSSQLQNFCHKIYHRVIYIMRQFKCNFGVICMFLHTYVQICNKNKNYDKAKMIIKQVKRILISLSIQQQGFNIYLQQFKLAQLIIMYNQKKYLEFFQFSQQLQFRYLNQQSKQLIQAYYQKFKQILNIENKSFQQNNSLVSSIINYTSIQESKKHLEQILVSQMDNYLKINQIKLVRNSILKHIEYKNISHKDIRDITDYLCLNGYIQEGIQTYRQYVLLIKHQNQAIYWFYKAELISYYHHYQKMPSHSLKKILKQYIAHYQQYIQSQPDDFQCCVQFILGITKLQHKIQSYDILITFIQIIKHLIQTENLTYKSRQINRIEALKLIKFQLQRNQEKESDFTSYLSTLYVCSPLIDHSQLALRFLKQSNYFLETKTKIKALKIIQKLYQNKHKSQFYQMATIYCKSFPKTLIKNLRNMIDPQSQVFQYLVWGITYYKIADLQQMKSNKKNLNAIFYKKQLQNCKRDLISKQIKQCNKIINRKILESINEIQKQLGQTDWERILENKLKIIGECILSQKGINFRQGVEKNMEFSKAVISIKKKNYQKAYLLLQDIQNTDVK